MSALIEDLLSAFVVYVLNAHEIEKRVVEIEPVICRESCVHLQGHSTSDSRCFKHRDAECRREVSCRIAKDRDLARSAIHLLCDWSESPYAAESLPLEVDSRLHPAATRVFALHLFLEIAQPAI